MLFIIIVHMQNADTYVVYLSYARFRLTINLAVSISYTSTTAGCERISLNVGEKQSERAHRLVCGSAVASSVWLRLSGKVCNSRAREAPTYLARAINLRHTRRRRRPSIRSKARLVSSQPLMTMCTTSGEYRSYAVQKSDCAQRNETKHFVVLIQTC